MTVMVEPASLVHALRERRRTQQHLDRLSRQIAARAGRQVLSRAVTARTSMRTPRRGRSRPAPSDKALFQERVACLTFERWSEFDALTIRLFRQDQMIERLRQGDHSREPQRAPGGGPEWVMLVEGHSG